MTRGRPHRRCARGLSVHERDARDLAAAGRGAGRRPRCPRPSTTPPPTLDRLPAPAPPRTPCPSTNPIHTLRRSAERPSARRSTADPVPGERLRAAAQPGQRLAGAHPRHEPLHLRGVQLPGAPVRAARRRGAVRRPRSDRSSTSPAVPSAAGLNPAVRSAAISSTSGSGADRHGRRDPAQLPGGRGGGGRAPRRAAPRRRSAGTPPPRRRGAARGGGRRRRRGRSTPAAPAWPTGWRTGRAARRRCGPASSARRIGGLGEPVDGGARRPTRRPRRGPARAPARASSGPGATAVRSACRSTWSIGSGRVARSAAAAPVGRGEQRAARGRERVQRHEPQHRRLGERPPSPPRRAAARRGGVPARPARRRAPQRS